MRQVMINSLGASPTRAFVLLLGVAASLGLATSAHAATFAVTTTTDGGPGSLRQAIISANANPGADTITVPDSAGGSGLLYARTITGSDSVGPTAAAAGDLDITGDLVITGTGDSRAIVYAGPPSGSSAGTPTDRVFEITGGAKVTLSRLSITGGKVPVGEPNAGGGGVKVTNGELTLNDAFVIQNTAFGAGGGILLMKGKLTANESYIANNTSETYHGGGIAHAYGDSTPTSITLTDTALNQNHADSETGGGIADLGAGTLTLTRSFVTGNTANWGGGINASGDATTIVDTYIASNKARTTSSTAPGGGILIQGGGTLELSRSLVTANQAGVGAGISQQPGGGPVSVVNSTFSANVAQTSAGAIRTEGAGASVVNSTFADNTAPSGSALIAGAGTLDQPITLFNSIVSGDAQNCAAGKIVSGGHNLDSGQSCPFTQTGDLRSTDAKLGPLESFEQNDHHHPLLAGSPAINAADAAHCPAVDTRRMPRVAASCDMGAYEADAGVVPDTVAPITTVSAAAPPPFGSTGPGGGFIGTVELTVTTTDPEPSSGGVVTRCVLDPPSAPATYADIPATPGCPATLTGGNLHKVYAASIDATGNTSALASTTFTILFTPDTTITKAPTGPINHAPTLEFTASTAGATFECAIDGIDGGGFKPCTSPYTPPLPPDGTYLFRVRAIYDGIRDPVSATTDLVIDTVAPTTTVGVEAASDGQEVGPGRFAGAVNLQRSLDDPAPSGVGVGAAPRCVLDPPAPPEAFADIPASSSCPLRFSEIGRHTFYTAARDAAGNIGPVSSASFTIVALPDTTITEGPSGPTSGAPRFSFASTIPGSKFECQLDGAAFQNCASPVAAYQLGPGGHHFGVRSISPDGGIDPTPASAVFNIEITTLTTPGCVADFVDVGPSWDAFCAPFFDSSSCPPDGAFPEGAGDFHGRTICSVNCPAGAKCTLTMRGTAVDEVAGDGISAHLWMSAALAKVDITNTLSARAEIRCDSEPAAPNATSARCPASITISALGPIDYASAQCSIDRLDKRLDKARVKGSCSATLTMTPALPLGVVVANTAVGVLLPAAGTLTVGSGTTGSKKSQGARAARASAPKKKSKKKPLVATTSATTNEPGPVSLPLTLSADAKKTLAKKGKLTVSLTTVFKPAAGGATVTKTQKVTLTPKPKMKRCKTKATIQKPLPCGT